MGESLRLKAKSARDHHLGGVMIWELSEDDEQSSLLNAISEVVRSARPSPGAPSRPRAAPDGREK